MNPSEEAELRSLIAASLAADRRRELEAAIEQMMRDVAARQAKSDRDREVRERKLAALPADERAAKVKAAKAKRLHQDRARKAAALLWAQGEWDATYAAHAARYGALSLLSVSVRPTVYSYRIAKAYALHRAKLKHDASVDSCGS